MTRPLLVLPRARSAVLVLVLALAACGGAEEPAGTTDGADAPGEITTPATDAGTQGPAATDTAATEPADAAGTDAAGTEAADVGGVGGGLPDVSGVEGCDPPGDLSFMVVNSFGDTVLEVAPFQVAGGHAILDLDGSGFGPVLAGVLTTDPAADAASLAEDWASPGTPPEGHHHLVFALTGPEVGARSFPTGTYDWIPEQGGGTDPTMSLITLSLYTPEGSSRPFNSETALELTHFGDGLLCGRLVPTSTEAPQGSTAQFAEGTFVTTLAEQP